MNLTILSYGNFQKVAICGVTIDIGCTENEDGSQMINIKLITDDSSILDQDSVSIVKQTLPSRKSILRSMLQQISNEENKEVTKTEKPIEKALKKILVDPLSSSKPLKNDSNIHTPQKPIAENQPLKNNSKSSPSKESPSEEKDHVLSDLEMWELWKVRV